MSHHRFLPVLALAALPFVGCAAQTPEPRLPAAVTVDQARHALETAGLKSGTLEGPKGTLRYFEGGTGKTVVLVHGSGSQAGDWQGVVPALLKGHHVLVLDLPGHGESGPAEGPLPVGDLVESLGALLDARNEGKPAVLVGNSLGGWVTLLYALHHPDRVERVIGISSSGIFATLKVPFAPKTRDEARTLLTAIRGQYMPAPTDAELDELLRKVAASPAPRLLAGLRAEDFLDTQAGGIKVPVDLIWGEEDGVLPLDYGRRLASLIPQARFHPLPRCGHMPQVHCPRALSGVLLEMIGG